MCKLFENLFYEPLHLPNKGLICVLCPMSCNNGPYFGTSSIAATICSTQFNNNLVAETDNKRYKPVIGMNDF